MSDRDWEEAYRQGQTPWDTGFPCTELVKVLEDNAIAPGRALDLGCGTGTNAIYLAQKGFEVTAVDVSKSAIEKARGKTEAAEVQVLYLLADLSNMSLPGGPYDFVFDRGCFHTLRSEDMPGFVEMLERLTREKSLFLLLTGNAKEPRDPGPPTMTEDEIRETFSRLFDFIWVREFRFDTTDTSKGPLGYSSMMRRSG